MRKNIKKFILPIGAAVLALSAFAVFAAPGTNDDPLVSLSYITDTLVPELHSYVDSKISAISTGSSNGSTASQPGFSVVDVKQGQTVKGGNGCEMILRMGSATVNASQSGGLSDVTAGFDLPQGYAMPANHLLVVPINDGRGVTMTTDGKIMIKGAYSVE